jgi:hypothetical protein
MRKEVEKITQERVLEMLVNGNQVSSALYVVESRAMSAFNIVFLPTAFRHIR